MEFLIELAKYKEWGAILALTGLVAYIVMQHQKTVKGFLRHDSENDSRHNKTYQQLTRNIKENTKVTRETYDFMKSLNGSMRRAVKKKQLN